MAKFYLNVGSFGWVEIYNWFIDDNWIAMFGGACIVVNSDSGVSNLFLEFKSVEKVLLGADAASRIVVKGDGDLVGVGFEFAWFEIMLRTFVIANYDDGIIVVFEIGFSKSFVVTKGDVFGGALEVVIASNDTVWDSGSGAVGVMTFTEEKVGIFNVFDFSFVISFLGERDEENGYYDNNDYSYNGSVEKWVFEKFWRTALFVFCFTCAHSTYILP